MAVINIDTSEMKKFFDSVNKLGNGDIEKELKLFLEGIGVEFLRVLRDEIKRRKVVDSRQLLKSFIKDEENNIWKLKEGNLTLEVGTSVNYANYVNDGHGTCRPGEERRFVPGYWKGDRFVYDKSAKGGMLLKAKFVDGNHYWDNAVMIIEKMLPDLMEAKMRQFLENYF